MTFLFPVIRAAFGMNTPSITPTAEECEELIPFRKETVYPSGNLCWAEEDESSKESAENCRFCP